VYTIIGYYTGVGDHAQMFTSTPNTDWPDLKCYQCWEKFERYVPYVLTYTDNKTELDLVCDMFHKEHRPPRAAPESNICWDGNEATI